MYTFRDFIITDGMMGSIQDYIENRVRPGGFLSAIICNDLKKAVMFANDINIKNIPAFVEYFYNNAPTNYWGSDLKMNHWLGWPWT